MNAQEILDTFASLAAEQRREFDLLDRGAGDGDFGSTLARGGGAVREALEHSGEETDADLLVLAARTLTARMGGSSGPLIGVAFLRAGQALRDGADIGTVLERAREGIAEYGGAEVGDKTLVDALSPAIDALVERLPDGDPAAALTEAARAAAEGAESTRELVARRGRASYVGARSKGAPDAGAVAVAMFVGELARAAGGEAPDLTGLLRASADGGAGGEDAGETEERTAHFYDEPDTFVDDVLRGLAAAEPALEVDLEARFVRRRDTPEQGRVALVSGGGSGHEPLHAGYVGAGMLDAACPGAVFTSPSPDQMLAATRAVDGGAGVLHIVKNYTGDVMNFRLAAELAGEEGIEVRSVVVADDVAVKDSDHTVGRRGTGLTIVVEKVAGARAAAGGSLDEVVAVAEKVMASGGSFGIALGPANIPGSGPSFELDAGEVEIGVGIHGEPGRRTGPLGSAGELARELVDPVLEELSLDRGAEVLAIVNGFGGTTQLELLVLFGHVHRLLEARGITIARRLVGDYITSLDMPGASLTLCKLDEELTELWDAPVETGALRW